MATKVKIVNIYSLLPDENEEAKTNTAAAKAQASPASAKPAASKAPAAKQAPAAKGESKPIPGGQPPAQPKAAASAKNQGSVPAAVKQAEKEAAPKSSGDEGIVTGKPPRPAGHKDRPHPRQVKERQYETGSRRVFDRRPGTGRPLNEQKKGGAGKANWGAPGSEIEEALSSTANASAAAEGAAPEAEKASPSEAAKEEEDKTMTYEEYLAKKRKPKLPEIREERKPESSNPEWKDYVPLKRDEETAPQQQQQKQQQPTKKKDEKKKEEAKKAVPLDQIFHVRVEDGADRGRGRGRGGRGRGGGANSAEGGEAPRGDGSLGGRSGRSGRGGRGGGTVDLTSKDAFPSLPTSSSPSTQHAASAQAPAAAQAPAQAPASVPAAQPKQTA